MFSKSECFGRVGMKHGECKLFFKFVSQRQKGHMA